MAKVSVQVLTKNSGRTIRQCLQSIIDAGFTGGDILVVDSGSTDETLDVAREFGVRLLEHPFSTYGEQQNWALSQQTTEWVLVIDSDEWLSPELAAEIPRLIEGGADGYWLHRVNIYLGRTIRYSGWQNDRVLRLYRRERGRFSDRRDDHSEAIIDGTVASASHPLMHSPYADLTDHLNRIQTYSAKGADEFLARGKRVSVLGALARAKVRFFRSLVLRQGFRDGTEGLILAMMTSIYVLMKYLKAWERSR